MHTYKFIQIALLFASVALAIPTPPSPPNPPPVPQLPNSETKSSRPVSHSCEFCGVVKPSGPAYLEHYHQNHREEVWGKLATPSPPNPPPVPTQKVETHAPKTHACEWCNKVEPSGPAYIKHYKENHEDQVWGKWAGQDAKASP
ncbi:hypothetical protein PoMZ_02496 [Pyricularia oryzae]|uniref:C2H2-type domain-containing protein n=1 Tax=Pyricularia oryzae TaxID=318829 RepID=A0A4P7N4X8_PYROR|nr:hypothetical protein PoMZ_02496 [Pyricularia oryzae]